MLCIIRHQPETSALRRSMHPGEWSQTEHFLAGIFDQLAFIDWRLRHYKGGKPKQLPRPGDRKPPVFGGTRMTLTQAREKEARRQAKLREKVD